MKNSIEKIGFDDKDAFFEWCSRLTVPKQETHFLSLIEEHAKESKNRKLRKKLNYLESISVHMLYDLRGNYLKYDSLPSKSTVMDIDVTEKTIKRAYLFMNYFIRAISATGGRVEVDTVAKEDNIQLRWKYCQMMCRLYEKKIQYREVKEKKNCMIPSYELVPTGELILELAVEKEKKYFTFKDKTEEPLENQIGQIFRELFPVISQLQVRLEKQEQEEKKREIEEYQRWEEDWKKQQEQKRLEEQKEKERIYREKIAEQALRWSQIKQVELYLIDLREQISKRAKDEQKLIEDYCCKVEQAFNRETLYQEIFELMKEGSYHKVEE